MTNNLPLYRVPELLSAVELETVGRGIRVPRTYAGVPTAILLRMHLLPYLIPLSSERLLAFEVAERQVLQGAVGIQPSGSVPSRATLWHFRRRNAKVFRQLMARSLALLAMVGISSGEHLPFVDIARANRPRRRGLGEDRFVDKDGHEIAVFWSAEPVANRGRQNDAPHLPGLTPRRGRRHLHPAPKHWLYEHVGFPIYAEWQAAGVPASVVIKTPEWLDEPYNTPDLTDYFGREGKTPYTACNIIVLRRHGGREEILLAKRLRGTGAGTFALPGGKKYPRESVVACVKRELFEEVGLEYQAGRPVSVRRTERRGFPRVTSIGVLATLWKGTPRRREHLAHSEWDWYKLTALPEPLFFPTEMALTDFLSNRASDLDWDCLENEDALLPPLLRRTL